MSLSFYIVHLGGITLDFSAHFSLIPENASSCKIQTSISYSTTGLTFQFTMTLQMISKAVCSPVPVVWGHLDLTLQHGAL